MFANSSLSVESLSQLTLEKERKKKTNKRNVTFYKMMMLITFNDDQTIADLGAFNLHLLEFTFVYQFYSRKTTLVESTF